MYVYYNVISAKVIYNWLSISFLLRRFLKCNFRVRGPIERSLRQTVFDKVGFCSLESIRRFNIHVLKLNNMNENKI
jgi:hypothetical protein